MEISSGFFELLEEIEGKENFVYPDSGGAPTIGIGHLLTKAERMSGKIFIDGVPVRYREGLSDEQIYSLCKNDVRKATKEVNEHVNTLLTANQFDALVSFTFNVGGEAFATSTLLKVLNQGKYEEVPTQMRRWNKDNGVVVQGLINRREDEIAHWLKK